MKVRNQLTDRYTRNGKSTILISDNLNDQCKLGVRIIGSEITRIIANFFTSNTIVTTSKISEAVKDNNTQAATLT